ncbi:MAG: hypothetical protein O6922_09060, partial [Chloroflexi bacterium]|nr:hypothetical protein [Chloroflexota bacterium]
SQLEEAHDQAKRELSDEKLASAIEKMVVDGLIDKSEADSFAAWMADRPESADDALFSTLTSSAFNLRLVSLAGLELPRLGLRPGGDVIERMAMILGVDVQELTDALEGGASGPASGDRLAALHSAVDDLLESGSITADEATELHAWVDEIPQWLLDLDLGSKILPLLGFGHGERLLPGGLKGFDFGFPFGRDHSEPGNRGFFFGDGNRNFEFEFRLPEGTFRFGPGGALPDGETLPFDGGPFSDGRFPDFFDRFDFGQFGGIEGLEGLGELKNLEDLFERFRGPGWHAFPIPPSIEPDGSGGASDASPKSA